MSETFPLRGDRPWSWLLRVIGVRPGATQVELTDDDRLVATCGPDALARALQARGIDGEDQRRR